MAVMLYMMLHVHVFADKMTDSVEKTARHELFSFLNKKGVD